MYTFRPGDFVVTPDGYSGRVTKVENDLIEVDSFQLEALVKYDRKELQFDTTKMQQGSSTLPESLSLPENLWEVYAALKSYSNIQEGTVEFNKLGDIEKLTVHFKRKY